MIYQKENQSQSEGTKKLVFPHTIQLNFKTNHQGGVGVLFLNKFVIQKFVLKVSYQFERKKV